MSSHLPEAVHIGAALGPVDVHLSRDRVTDYLAVTNLAPDGDEPPASCPPTMLESYMNALAVVGFSYSDYGRFHAKVSLRAIRSLPVDSVVTITGDLVDVYSKGESDFLVIQFLAANELGERMVEMEVHHLVMYKGGNIEFN